MKIAHCLVAALLLQVPVAALSQAPDAAAAADGKLAYMAAGCYQCHGIAAHGGVGPRLAPNPMPLEALSAFVRHAARNMPPYPVAVLADADLQRIHRYLASITASPAPDQIPQLKQMDAVR
ncbi:MAG: cytochrome c [Pseudomonadota bacterium]